MSTTSSHCAEDAPSGPPSWVRPRLRPSILTLVVLALLTGACGGGAPTTAPTEPESPTAPKAEAPTTRSVEHALGVAQIPTDPRRIVVLNQYSLLDYLVALGVSPVGSSGDPAADYPGSTA